MPTSALTSDYRYLALPESPNNLSVRHHVTSDHVQFLVRASSRRQSFCDSPVLRGVQADP
jgi:hypothetical protein